MINTYTLTNAVPQLTDAATAPITLMIHPTQAEVDHICKSAGLNPLTFSFRDSATEVSRYHPIVSSKLQQPFLLVVYDFMKDQATIEDQLSPVIMIFDNQRVIISATNDQTFIELTKTDLFSSPCDLLVKYVALCQDHLLSALTHYRKELNALDQAARTTMNTENLRRLTDLTREIVFFEHTMNDQDQTIQLLIDSANFNNIDEDLLNRITIQQRRLNKTIHIFKDLLLSISGLFTSMMDSNLNNLMKFLDSAGLVLAVAALVTGFMGMNVGGLPLKSNQEGFWLTLLVAAILSVIIAVYLKRKQYNK